MRLRYARKQILGIGAEVVYKGIHPSSWSCMAKSKSPKRPDVLDGAAVIRDVLKKAEPRPTPKDSNTDKIQYAVRFADLMAARLAVDLSPRLKGIEASTARRARSAAGSKQLDINFSTPQLGLALGISLKSVHLRDAKTNRYTHNKKRNEEELRIEASGYHKRQPFAVMVGILFLPFDACVDGKENNASSFGSWVRHLRPFAERERPEDNIDRFEKLYIGLYEPSGRALEFFDIADDPPKNSRPTKTLKYEAFLDAIYHAYLRRNSFEFKWADGGEAPLAPVEEDSEDDEDEDDDIS